MNRNTGMKRVLGSCDGVSLLNSKRHQNRNERGNQPVRPFVSKEFLASDGYASCIYTYQIKNTSERTVTG